MTKLTEVTDLAVLTVMLAGCADKPSTQLPVDASRFVGDWVISNWEERGTLTHKYDGRLVTINQSKTPGLFYIESTDRMALPDSFFEDARYSLVGRSLIGTTIPNYDELKDLFSTTPDNVLRDAAASKSVVYRMKLEMLGDGQIVATRNNMEIWYDQTSGRFTSVQQLPNWKKFTLSRR
jgi:hypothetical protein